MGDTRGVKRGLSDPRRLGDERRGARGSGARAFEPQGVRISPDDASHAQQQDFAELKSSTVAGWLRHTFSLKAEPYLDVRRSECDFQVALEPPVAISILDKADTSRKLHINRIPVRVNIWRGSKWTTHTSPQANLAARDPHSGPPDASDDVAKFWRRMQIAVEANRMASNTEQLKLHEPSNRTHWLACWAVAAAGAPGSCEVLLRVLLSAPAKANIAPPAADVVQVFSRLVTSLETHGERQQLQALNILELMVDAVETRLMGHEAHVFDVDGMLAHVSALQSKFMEKVMGVMNGLGTQAMMRSGKLMGRFTSLMPKYSDALQRARHLPTRNVLSVDSERTLPPWLGWQQPTIGWLMGNASKDCWLRASALQTIPGPAHPTSHAI